MKLKVCGMKFKDNILDVAALQPNYLGFIFHEPSSRNFEVKIPVIKNSIKKVGVFVDEKIEFISHQIDRHQLDAVQLHGYESPEICRILKGSGVEVIKVFSIKDKFDFSVLEPYEEVCNFFLFDTKGKLPGGNGYTFNWNTLKEYPSSKPFFLSGGIGLDEIKNIRELKNSPIYKYCYALDINSKFEIEPGLKNIEKVKKFKSQL